MQGSRVDLGAWLRSAVPLWAVWLILLAPLVWLSEVWTITNVDAVDADFGGGSTVYDESGTPVLTPAPDPPPLPMRIVIMLLLGHVGFQPTWTALVALCLAAGVLVARLGVVDRARLRWPAGVGALLCFVPTLLTLAMLVLRDSALDGIPADVRQSIESGVTQRLLEWASLGIVTGVLGWVFVRVGWGRLPMRAEPEPAPAAVPADQPLGARPDAAAPSSVDPTAAPAVASPDRIGMPPTPDLGGDLADRGWDIRPELPPDFRAPEPGVSPFARPAPGLRPGEAVESAASADPYAAYRRPD